MYTAGNKINIFLKKNLEATDLALYFQESRMLDGKKFLGESPVPFFVTKKNF